MIGVVIIGFWLVMMGLLVKREVLIPRLHKGNALAYQDHATDTWMGFYLSDDACVGFVNTKTRPDVRAGEYGQAIEYWVRMSMTVLSFPTEIQVRGTAWAPRDRGLSDFELTLRSGEHIIHVAAKVHDGMLDGALRTAGETFPLQFRVGNDLLLSGNTGMGALNVPDLAPGDEVFVDTFDPMTMSVTKAQIRCIGEEAVEFDGRKVPAKVIETITGALKTKAWVAADNDVLRAETPFGFIMKKITQEQALDALEAGKNISEDLLNIVAIRPTGKAPVRGAVAMRIRLSGVNEDAKPPEDDTQRAEGPDVYAIRMPDEPFVAGAAPLEGADRDAALASDAFVQTKHPRIAETSKEIVGETTDTWERALKVYEWVYRTIEKRAVMSVPSALDVLETKEGDCNEHTVLFTALARAAGVPTRIAIGVAWSDELRGYYYHAWPEVYVGRWVWMDPTLGQPVADATHLKLLTGGIEQWPQLVAYLGQLKIEVVNIETAAQADAAKAASAEVPEK